MEIHLNCIRIHKPLRKRTILKLFLEVGGWFCYSNGEDRQHNS